jgi:Integrase core domain
LRSDNGAELIAYAILDWLEERQIKTLYIRPGSPWENGHIESFHDKLRDECLNRELFGTLAEARIILESWRVEYNEKRPHSSLSYQTPEEFARRTKFGFLPASFRPNLPTSTARDLMESNNRQNYTFNLSSFWGQATTLKKY